ncbi:hypothetical protein OG689_10130 [Kitasatospora sp. NBC_00240]|uniref:hypothetical protein n=1 Tax=Kitasatospora sp. NBC_00240 TaxID=2903567 RepID=UPI002253C20D|nr:hypothetical protein [Kitasatospora sp. NBC_00240]MCX5209641.1 hypothetical protein [Kitasatospora sp. NBC_00240]
MTHHQALPAAPAPIDPGPFAARLGAFVRGSFPLPLSLVFAAVWAVGATGLFAAADGRAEHWRPGWGTVVAAVTVLVDLLLLRAADDLRDLPYDRRHNPARPLARGAVLPRDLYVLAAAGAAVLLLLNAGNRAALLLLAAQLAYTTLLVGAELRFGWPRGDAVVTGVLLSSPVQILLNLYLYAVFLHDTGADTGSVWAGRHVVPLLLVIMFAATHHELARKIVREPGPDERTYVRVFGLRATILLALVFAAASAGVSLAVLRPWAGGAAGWWGWLALLPAVLAALAARGFTRAGAARWPVAAVAGYLPVVFVCHLLIGLGSTS